jgi:hypothetical protein
MDPNPHLVFRLDPDPDPHKTDADPKHWSTNVENCRRCEQKRRKTKSVLSNNVEHFSMLWATTRKNVRRCGQQRGWIATTNSERFLCHLSAFQETVNPNLRTHFTIKTLL